MKGFGFIIPFLILKAALGVFWMKFMKFETVNNL